MGCVRQSQGTAAIEVLALNDGLGVAYTSGCFYAVSFCGLDEKRI